MLTVCITVCRSHCEEEKTIDFSSERHRWDGKKRFKDSRLYD